MSKQEEQRLTEDKPQLVQPDNNEDSSSGESDEQPGTSSAVAMQAGMPHGPADAGNQVLQTMENAETSLSFVSRIDPEIDLKNIKPTQVKEKQINPLDSAKRFEPRTEQQKSANNLFDLPQLNTQTQDPPDVTHPKQPIEANPQVEPHTDISEVTNQSNALNTEIPSTSND
ncbi:uncharacterized protein LOC143453241 [Clavelina lepadiformis]|uniref:uncharacterized protein LOC143453241 n=1 Tax=Clavelina lepadiformis TaxID=159417 RepID=UPI004041E6E2